MIPPNRADILDTALSILGEFGSRTGVRGRFVALYLGLRRMGSAVAPLGSPQATSASEIEDLLDRMFTKAHRPEPYVVLTAPFGGSTSPTAPYSTRSGQVAPGHRSTTNNWRNNFAIQKGIGCPAEPGVIDVLLHSPAVRLACPHMTRDPEERPVCSLRDTGYRGEEHSIWLRMAPGGGYQVVDLDLPAVYKDYLRPGGMPIPVFPLIATLYSMASPGSYPARQRIGIPDFAADFGFDLAQVEALFGCDPESPPNATLLARVEGVPIPAPAPAPPGEAEVELPPGELPELFPAGELNTGVGAELAVAGDLQRHNWHVLYRGNQRGIGYDLEATRNDLTLRVEVKSSVGFTNPEMNESEWEAAQRYGEEYVLAVVDFYGSDQQKIWYVRDPAGSAEPAERQTIVYKFPRSDMLPLATEADFL